MDETVEGPFGFALNIRKTDPARTRRMDEAVDAAAAAAGVPALVDRLADETAARSILACGIAVPGREGDAERAMRQLGSIRHRVTCSIVPMEDRGRFANVEAAISRAGQPLETFDWLVILDDDVALPPAFSDRFIGISEIAGFAIAQPAHLFHSYASHPITQRKPGTLARATRFVEIGPVCALHRSTFHTLLPFPPSRWGWGIDMLWSHLADRHGWRMGVVDATPIEHLRPVGTDYNRQAAMAEALAMLEARGLAWRRDIFRVDAVAIGWDGAAARTPRPEAP